jgi:hypothetical protein
MTGSEEDAATTIHRSRVTPELRAGSIFSCRYAAMSFRLSQHPILTYNDNRFPDPR